MPRARHTAKVLTGAGRASCVGTDWIGPDFQRNAGAFLAVQRDFGTFDAYLWLGRLPGLPERSDPHRGRDPGQLEQVRRDRFMSAGAALRVPVYPVVSPSQRSLKGGS